MFSDPAALVESLLDGTVKNLLYIHYQFSSHHQTPKRKSNTVLSAGRLQVNIPKFELFGKGCSPIGLMAIAPIFVS